MLADAGDHPPGHTGQHEAAERREHDEASATSTRRTDGRASLSTDPATTASTESASVSVITVPPPATPTARSRNSPRSWTIGYATSVCDAHSDPNSIAVESRAAIRLELVEVELKARQEHEDEDPEVAQRLDSALALDPAERERPDDQAAEDDPDDARQPDPLDEQGADEDDERRDEERPFGRPGRELDGKRHAASVPSASDELGRSAAVPGQGEPTDYAAARSANFA
jgi:hypothetical protein